MSLQFVLNDMSKTVEIYSFGAGTAGGASKSSAASSTWSGNNVIRRNIIPYNV